VVELLLIVEDEPSLAAELEALLATHARRIELAPTLQRAREVLAREAPQVVLLDVKLPDGDAEQLLAAITAVQPLPRVIAMSGSAAPEQTFRLAQAGVRAFLPKPLAKDAVLKVWSETLSRPPDVTPHLRGAVGHVPLHALEEQVRETVVQEALASTKGSRTAAAKLLKISRQLLQHILKR